MLEDEVVVPHPPRTTVTPIVEGRNLRKVYHEEDGSELVILEGVSVSVDPGEAVAVIGASGAGKSTLLHLLGLLDRPTHGLVLLAGQDIGELSAKQLALVRNQRVGFVFQFHHLLREFTALENVMMPMLIGGASKTDARGRAQELLAEVGLSARAAHKSSELSGGEQQRVAVARALVNRPDVLIADEPSGNLDSYTSAALHELFFRLRADHGVALVLATHNAELAARTDRVLQVKDGQLSSVGSAV